MKRMIVLLALSLSIFASAENTEAPDFTLISSTAKPSNSQTVKPSNELTGQERVQCRAVTKSGNRCKRRAAPGKRYCHQHASDVKPKKPAARCRSMTEDGSQCESKPAEGGNYCEKHLDK